MTVLRIQDFALVMSPTVLSTTRSSLSKTLSTLLKRVRFLKLRISSLCPTTSHCCLRLKILLKALLRLGRRTNSCSAGFTTVLAGARSKCGPITSLSLCKRKLDVRFISRSEDSGETSLRCFQAKTGRIKKRFPTEKIFPQDINRFWETMNRYSDSLIRKIL